MEMIMEYYCAKEHPQTIPSQEDMDTFRSSRAIFVSPNAGNPRYAYRGGWATKETKQAVDHVFSFFDLQHEGYVVKYINCKYTHENCIGLMDDTHSGGTAWPYYVGDRDESGITRCYQLLERLINAAKQRNEYDVVVELIVGLKRVSESSSSYDSSSSSENSYKEEELSPASDRTYDSEEANKVDELLEKKLGPEKFNKRELNTIYLDQVNDELHKPHKCDIRAQRLEYLYCHSGEDYSVDDSDTEDSTP
jgi:hypothetical protein